MRRSRPFFSTRWTLSYLAGPLTRLQIRDLQPPRTVEADPPAPPSVAEDAPSNAPPVPPGTSSTRPLVAPGVPQVFLPIEASSAPGRPLYVPRLLAIVRMHYVKTRQHLSADEDLTLLLTVPVDALHPDWSEAQELPWTEQELQRAPQEPCEFAPVPTLFGQKRRFSQWQKALSNHLYHTRRFDLWKSNALNKYSQPGESERDFRIRLLDRAREERDRQVEDLRDKYLSKFRTLEERIRRAEQAVQREVQEAESAKVDSMISLGASVLGALIGRKRLSSRELGRATSAARGFGKAAQQAEQVRQAEDSLQAYQSQLLQLQADLEKESRAIAERLDPLQERFEIVPLKPRRTDIDIRLLALAWEPIAR